MGCYVCGRPCFGTELTPTVDGLRQTCSDYCNKVAQQGDFDPRGQREEGNPFRYWCNREERVLLYRWLANRRQLSRCVVTQINGSFLRVRVSNKHGIWMERCWAVTDLWLLSFGWREEVATEIKLMRRRLR